MLNFKSTIYPLFTFLVILSGCTSFLKDQPVISEITTTNEIDTGFLIIEKNGRILNESDMTNEMKNIYALAARHVFFKSK